MTIFNASGNELAKAIIGFSIAVVLIVAGDFIFALISRKKFTWFVLWAIQALMLVSFSFMLNIPAFILLAFMALWMLICVSSNISEISYLITSPFDKGSFLAKAKRKADSKKPETLIDREQVYQNVKTAVLEMSQKKIGALITFMRKDDLLAPSMVGPIIKQRGVDINAPVTPELIETIFFEGTRLHDGGIIIKDDKIARAAVFYNPTTTPMTGKFGSRHQAAKGISENTDSVTVLVSEETGKISLAVDGEMIPLNPDNFMQILEYYIDLEPEEEGED